MNPSLPGSVDSTFQKIVEGPTVLLLQEEIP